ncbi:MAG: hypothetical protein ABSD89_04985 [Halobacteriota archaeon]
MTRPQIIFGVLIAGVGVALDLVMMVDIIIQLSNKHKRQLRPGY